MAIVDDGDGAAAPDEVIVPGATEGWDNERMLEVAVGAAAPVPF